MVYRIFCSIECFDLRNSELRWESISAVNGDSVCCTNASMETGARPFIAPMFPYLLLIKDGSITSIVPSGYSLIAILSGGFIGIMFLGSTSFSFPVSVLRSVLVLLFFLRSLYLSCEFFQVSLQALISETECFHFISIGLQSFKNVSWWSAIQVTLLIMRPRGVGVTPAHVSGRYHKSLRIQFYL